MTAPVKRYNVVGGSLVEGLSLGRIGVYLAADYERLEQECEKLRTDFRCPRPCNGRPDDFTSSQCLEAGECGCMPAGELMRGLRLEVEAMRALLVEAQPALQHLSDTAQDLDSFTLLERVRAALQAKP